MTNAIEALINEVRLCYQSLVQVGDQLHAGTGISMGMRAVLEYLDREGSTTVPDIARARRVSRQRVQALVNPLADRQLVAAVTNPASRRSPLISLTDAGRNLIREMRVRERRTLDLGVSDQRLRAAERTLRQLRLALEARQDQQPPG